MCHCGSGNKRNGAGIVLKNDYVDRVIELWRISDRIIRIKMELDGVALNIISAYAPQVECMHEEKESFLLDLNKAVEKIPRHERIILGTGMNGYVAEGNNGDEECMGRHALGRRND